MPELPYTRCDEDDEESLVCKEVQCHSRYHRPNYLNASCPVEISIRPIKCISIINGTVESSWTCTLGHDVGHNDSFIHVREGCAATFNACTDKNDDEKDPPSMGPPVTPPESRPVDPPTTRIPPSQSPLGHPNDGPDDTNSLTIGAAVGCGLVVLVIVVMVMLYYRRQKHRGKDNKNYDNKKVMNVISGDHVYADITPDDDVSNKAVRKPELAGDYVTIEDDLDRYDHCRHPSLDTENQTGNTDTYDSLGHGTRNVSVISDEKYDTTRDITYDHLHDKQNKSSLPGNYDVLPVQTNDVFV